MIPPDTFFGRAYNATLASPGTYSIPSRTRVAQIDATSAGVVLRLPDPDEFGNAVPSGGPWMVIQVTTTSVTLQDHNGAGSQTLAAGSTYTVVLDDGAWSRPTFPPATAAATPTLYAKVCGGGASGSEVADVSDFTVATEAWASGTSMPTARARAGGCAHAQRFYIAENWGGSAVAYKWGGSAWSALPNLSSAREGAMCDGLGGRVFMFGGDPGDLEILDCITDTWAAGESLPLLRTEGASSVVGFVDRIVLVTGEGEEQVNLFYHEPTGTYETIDYMLGALRRGLSAFTHDWKVYACGGKRFVDDVVTDAVDRFEPITRVWSSGGALPAERYEHAAFHVDPSAGYAAAGLDGSDVAQSDVYRVRDTTWATTSNPISTAHTYVGNQAGSGIR